MHAGGLGVGNAFIHQPAPHLGQDGAEAAGGGPGAGEERREEGWGLGPGEGTGNSGSRGLP